MPNISPLTTFIQQKKIEVIVLFYILVVFFTGLSMQPLDELKTGLMRIFVTPGTLITDYMVVGGMGPAFVNAAVVAFIGYMVLVLTRVSFDGRSIAAVFTMMGFALMGKNIWSILPIIAGVLIYSKIMKRHFERDVYYALFGTALAPLVTQAAFSFGWGIPGGIIMGVLAGLIMSPVANHVLTFHEGYNLYNVGFAAGFIALIFLNILRGYGYNSQTYGIWGTEFDEFLRVYMILLFASMLILGLLLGKGRFKDYFLILKEPGTLITDFVDISGIGNTLINMGLLGFIGVAYISMVGGNFNGPTLSGLLTLSGFGAFGKHPWNTMPIMAGVWLGTLFSDYQANAPGALLAGLFGTTLAPIAGQFGPLVGILAGIAHLSVVSFIGIVHGGLNLYNNGLAAGFVAAFFVAIIKGIKKDVIHSGPIEYELDDEDIHIADGSMIIY